MRLRTAVELFSSREPIVGSGTVSYRDTDSGGQSHCQLKLGLELGGSNHGSGTMSRHLPLDAMPDVNRVAGSTAPPVSMLRCEPLSPPVLSIRPGFPLAAFDILI